MRLSLFGVVALVLTSAVRGAPPAKGGPPEDEIRQRENAWIRAVREQDLPSLEKLLAPDFAYTVAVAGRPLSTLSRDAYIHRAKGYEVEESRFDEIVVRFHGDVAVVTARFVQKAALHGKDRSAEFVLSDTWVRRGGAWLAVARTSSRPERPAADGEK
jgi:ketosteroid isomerase-like protein